MAIKKSNSEMQIAPNIRPIDHCRDAGSSGCIDRFDLLLERSFQGRLGPVAGIKHRQVIDDLSAELDSPLIASAIPAGFAILSDELRPQGESVDLSCNVVGDLLTEVENSHRAFAALSQTNYELTP
jgi:hypothetical protein